MLLQSYCPSLCPLMHCAQASWPWYLLFFCLESLAPPCLLSHICPTHTWTTAISLQGDSDIIPYSKPSLITFPTTLNSVPKKLVTEHAICPSEKDKSPQNDRSSMLYKVPFKDSVLRLLIRGSQDLVLRVMGVGHLGGSVS